MSVFEKGRVSLRTFQCHQELVPTERSGSMLQWARQLVSKGNKVIASCRNPSEASELQKVGVAHIAKLDVADSSSIEARFPIVVSLCSPFVAFTCI